MRSRLLGLAVTVALGVTPLLVACGGSGGESEPVASQEIQAERVKAPVLDGKWRQVGHTEGENGMIGVIDEDTIALWISADDQDWIYWCGSYEAPKDDSTYSWTSKADKGNMTGLLSSQDDSKDFTYAGGKLTFQFSIRGETTEVEMEQVSEESGLLTELRAGEGKTVEKGDADIQDLVLSDSCCTVGNGYVHYAIAINNPNEEYAPQSVNVSVVGRAEDGTISFSDNWSISGTLPGATTYWASQAGNGNVSDSDTIEIKLSVDDDDWYKTSLKYDFYQIENISMAEDSLGTPLATGEITLKEDVELKGFGDARSPMLVCALKGADGKLVGGFSTFIFNDLKVGEKTPFEIKWLGGNKVDFASAEIYANPW